MSDGRSAPARGLSLRRKLLFASVVFLLFFGAIYTVALVVRSNAVYRHHKDNERGWHGRAFQADPDLGFVHVPGARAEEAFPIGPSIPAHFDERGFRIPAQPVADPGPDAPLILFIGDSFTYGVGCPAEETFAHVAAQSLGARYANAGVSSWGLSQMLLRSEALIPTLRPDVVVVQFSPWLAERAQRFFAPSQFGKSPNPYFAEGADGQPFVHPPVFQSQIARLPFSHYRTSAPGIGDRLSFYLRVGFPLFVHDDLKVALFQIERLLGRFPPPVASRGKLVRFTYRRIAEVAEANGARMVVLAIGGHPQGLGPLPGVTVVDAHAEMLARLEHPQLLARRYLIWRGDPPVLVDMHPNPYAHGIIAEALVRGIRAGDWRTNAGGSAELDSSGSAELDSSGSAELDGG